MSLKLFYKHKRLVPLKFYCLIFLVSLNLADCVLADDLKYLSEDSSYQDKLGRQADGQAYRQDADGTKIVDYIAELEVSSLDLARALTASQEEIVDLRKEIERLKAGRNEFVTETDLRSQQKKIEGVQDSTQNSGYQQQISEIQAKFNKCSDSLNLAKTELELKIKNLESAHRIAKENQQIQDQSLINSCMQQVQEHQGKMVTCEERLNLENLAKGELELKIKDLESAQRIAKENQQAQESSVISAYRKQAQEHQEKLVNCKENLNLETLAKSELELKIKDLESAQKIAQEQQARASFANHIPELQTNMQLLLQQKDSRDVLLAQKLKSKDNFFYAKFEKEPKSLSGSSIPELEDRLKQADSDIDFNQLQLEINQLLAKIQAEISLLN